MHLRKLLASTLIIAAFGLNSCAERAQLPAKSFEGTITEVIQMPGLRYLMSGDTTDEAGEQLGMLGAMANVNVKMYIREDKLAYDVSTLGGLIKLHTIVDRNSRKLTMLMPNKMAVVTDLRNFDSIRGNLDDSLRAHTGLFDSLRHMLPQPTGKMDKIEGLDAEQYVATSGDLRTEMWLSNDSRIKAMEVLRDALLGRRRTGEGGMEQVFAMMSPIAGKLPVKFETTYKGKVVMTGGLRKIEEGKVEDEKFSIPSDYQIVNGDSLRHANVGGRPKERGYTAPADTTD